MNTPLAPPPAPQTIRPAAPLRGLAGLALLFALLLPPLLWRAAGQATLGADEVRSLMLTQQPLRRLIGSAPLADQFPPGYPILLKVWNKAGRLFGLPAGTLWSRLPGVLAWCAMVGTAWMLGRRQLGAGGGTLLAWMLALGSQGALAARLMSGEALAAPALAIALLTLLELAAHWERGRLVRNTAPADSSPSSSAIPQPPVPGSAGVLARNTAPAEENAIRPTYGQLTGSADVSSASAAVRPLTTASANPHPPVPGTADVPVRSPLALWALYTAAGILAVLTHRLAAPFMAGCLVLWLIWLISAFRIPHSAFTQSTIRNPQSAIRNPQSAISNSALRAPHSALLWGLLAHLLILLAALTPLFYLPADDRVMAGLRASWLDFTGPSGQVSLFALGHTFGLLPHALLGPRSAGALTFLALLAVLGPGLLLLYRIIFYRHPPLAADGRGARRLALAALFVAVFAVLLTRLLQRTPAEPFFAWPTGVLPGWAAGGAAATGLVLWTAHCSGRRALAWAVLLPWLLGCLVGQAIEVRHERRLAAALRQELARAAAPAAPLYVMPSELIPYIDRLCGSRPLRPLAALATLEPAAGEATLLQLNPWPLLDFNRDTVAAALAGAGKLSKEVRRNAIPSPLGMELVTLAGPDRPALAALAARGFAPRDPAPVPGTLLRVLPQDLLPGDGWGALEAGPQGEVWRWSMADTVRFRLPRPLPDGACTVTLKGMRLPHPPSAAAFSLRPAGGSQAFNVSVPQNWFEVRIPLAPGRGGSRTVLELTHPTFHLADFQPGATDPRRLGFLFLELRVSIP